MDVLRKLFGQSVTNYVVAMVVAVAVGVFRFLMLSKEGSVVLILHETISVAGLATFLIGALLMVAQWGAFDMLSYAFTPKRGKYKDFVEYTQRKAEKRSKEGYIFMPFFVVGVVLVLVSSFLA